MEPTPQGLLDQLIAATTVQEIQLVERKLQALDNRHGTASR